MLLNVCYKASGMKIIEVSNVILDLRMIEQINVFTLKLQGHCLVVYLLYVDQQYIQ